MKKLTSILLTLAMLLSITATAFAAGKDYPQNFWDVPKDHWAFSYIAELVNRGVISGYEDGSFRPDDTVTRGEWAKIMVLAAGLKPSDNNVYFTDMSGHWANIYINSAKDYLAAYTDGSFKPDQAAAREDVTVSMVKLKGYDVSRVDYSHLNQFKDTASISNSLKQYVAVAIEKGLITGFEDNTFRGQDTLTRAEAATLLWRAFQYGNDNKVVDTPTKTTPAQNYQNPVETPKQTATPTQTPTTPNPTAEPNNTSDTTPTELEPTETPKPYKVETLAKADVIGMSDYTSQPHVAFNNGGVIYYESSNKIYKLTQDGATEFLDVNSLTQENDFDEVKFTVNYLCCDVDGNLYAELNAEHSEDGLHHALYKVTNGKAELYKESEEYYPNYPKFIIGDNYIGKGGPVQGELTISCYSFGVHSSGDVVAKGELVCAAECDGVLIAAGRSSIHRYDYNTSTQIAEGYDSVGLSNKSYVIEKGGKFIIRSFDGANEVKLTTEDCFVSDRMSIKNSSISYRLFLTPDNNIIFYDTSAKAFRMISKND